VGANPFFRKIGVELEHLGIIALELFTQAVGMPDFIGPEVIGHARPLAQLDDSGAGERDLMERAAIGSKRRGQRLCVPAVVLGARRREAVAKAVELPRIDGVDLESAIEKRLDHRAMRNLDRNMDVFRLAAACGDEPIAHLCEPRAAMLEGPLAKALAAGVGKPDVMLLGRPIDARKPTLGFMHLKFPAVISSLRDICRSLYWRSRRILPTGLHIAATRRGTCPKQALSGIRGAGSTRLLPAGGSVWEGCADSLAPAVLRSATLHSAQPARSPPKPPENGTGSRAGFVSI
jgi:hypothetical protein